MALSDDPCIVAGAQGVGSLSREQLGAMIPEATYELRDFRIEDGAEVRMVGDDVAIVAYKVHEELIVDGKSVTVDAADSSTWVKRGGRWRCALHTESILGDPYGRDRTHGSPHAGA
jgi:hypothetical protein